MSKITYDGLRNIIHDDHGHTTEDCISLRMKVVYHKPKGHLQNVLPGEPTSNDRLPSPVHTKVVNCITGGSEIGSLTNSATKRHARERPDSYPIPDVAESSHEKELNTTKITFDQDDLDEPNQKHQDSLVIQLTIGNCLTKRILVDGGGSANVIFSGTLTIMGIDRADIVRHMTTLDATDDHEQALQNLKSYMMSPPLLTKPEPGEDLQLYLAVSSTTVSAVMVREEDKQQRPIYYVSESLLNAETRYTSMEKLFLGLIIAAKKLRHYFKSHHLTIVTNYPLKMVLRKPELTGRLAKCGIYLSGFDIEYKSQTTIKSQVLADFVSKFNPVLDDANRSQ
ncbi:LOW QUALITY PROTEIN: hypothetical protein OSB04_023793 [Centaurea solstitialis]|uniref:Reverse transcriptase/retrotransposon-derived protein RNase H-like domain-containing protein n=1 Tax=Centaurea solstitialis TaxID=347529 RepID=A0AA38WD97_9ASTR|nr:LOW QUALITY PROTEIN: hypothetical protein OSB04_023793 [Centaurea solstitialis]